MKIDVEAIKKKIQENKKTAKILAVVILVVVAVLVYVYQNSKVVDLEKYLSINYTGFESKGRANYSFDEEAFKTDYEDVIKLTSKGQKEYEDDSTLKKEGVAALFLEECIEKISIESNNSELSNGDIVTVKIIVNRNLASDYFGVDCQTDTYDFTVSELSQIEEIDPFEGVSIEYNGISGNASAKVVLPENNDLYNQIYYEFISESYNLSEGDIVTVEAYAYDNLEDVYGKTLSKTTKDFTVENLDSYLTSIEQISENKMTQITDQGKDIIMSTVVSTWEEPGLLDSITPVGNIVLNLKEAMTSSRYNQIAFVYKVKTKPQSTSDFLEYYYVIQYNNVVVKGDETIEIDLSNYTTYTSYKYKFIVDSRSYYGFQNMADIINDIITANQANYTSENNLLN